jgi:hypothetical protein
MTKTGKAGRTPAFAGTCFAVLLSGACGGNEFAIGESTSDGGNESSLADSAGADTSVSVDATTSDSPREGAPRDAVGDIVLRDGPSGGCGTCPVGTHCVGGSCVCDPTSCLGCCSSGHCLLGNDSAACGKGGEDCKSCSGYSCLAGTCSAQCTPSQLASNQGSPKGIAVDATNVYWTNNTDGRVMKCARDGCADAPTALATAQNQPTGIAVDATRVYWADGAGDVMACATGGCPAPKAITAGAMGFSRVAVSTGVVFFSSYAANAVYECPVLGCANILAPLVKSPSADVVAADPTYFFWADNTSTGSVNRCDRSNCAATATPLAPMESGPYGVAVDATSVYWVTRPSPGMGYVAKCAIGGCGGSPAVLAKGLSHPVDIAVDARNVYWTDDVDGALYACPLGGCPGTVAPPAFAKGQAYASAIAVDVASVYFTNLVTAGAVMKCAK